jgi:ADP-dependent phosphofructokinase/glucokinase
MSIELLKVLVQPVAIERDEDGRIIGEKVGEAIALFTPEQISEYVDQLREQIDQANRNGTEAAR